MSNNNETISEFDMGESCKQFSTNIINDTIHKRNSFIIKYTN